MILYIKSWIKYLKLVKNLIFNHKKSIMTKPKFNLSWYWQILIKEDFSTNKNKGLFDDHIFMELLSLEPSVKTQLFYNYKNKYFDLI